jgi:hypothetical protein
MTPQEDIATIDLVQEWTNDFSTALRQVESRRLPPFPPPVTDIAAWHRSIESAALALRCVVAALQKVRDKRTAVAAVQILQADCARLSPGPTHVIDEALTRLEEHIINPFEVDQDLDAWANAVRLVRSRIEPDQRAALRDAIDADIEAFAAKHHLGTGMFVRNLLRRYHYEEAVLQVSSLDEVWDRILSEALADPPTD